MDETKQRIISIAAIVLFGGGLAVAVALILLDMLKII